MVPYQQKAIPLGKNYIIKQCTLYSILFLIPAFLIGQQENRFIFIAEKSTPDPYSLDPGSRWKWEKETVYDTALLRIQYEMSFENHLQTGKYKDNRIVYIGQHGFRKDVSKKLEEVDQRIKWDSAGFSHLLGFDSVYPAEWFIPLQGNSWCLFRNLDPSPFLRFEEDMAHFSWQLLQEVDTIAGYPCQKAETFYQGRKYEAWYSADIPLDGGPYKFCGLPGLILKIGDTAMAYSWKMTGIEHGHWLITEKQFMVQKLSREKARKIIHDAIKSPYLLYRLLGYEIYAVDQYRQWRPADEKELNLNLHFTPIELE